MYLKEPRSIIGHSTSVASPDNDTQLNWYPIHEPPSLQVEAYIQCGPPGP